MWEGGLGCGKRGVLAGFTNPFALLRFRGAERPQERFRGNAALEVGPRDRRAKRRRNVGRRDGGLLAGGMELRARVVPPIKWPGS